MRKQEKTGSADAGPAADDVHALAAQGVSGQGSSLPYAEQIQRSFGAHDIGAIQAHSGEQAASASHAIGAKAYATGHHVAFAGAPDLHTTAHEAAHVVQQRAGIQLKGGVGQSGDAYEHHADAVADAVVAGRSAEALLDEAPASTASAAGVQRKTAGVQRQADGAGAAATATAEPAREQAQETKLVYRGAQILEMIRASGLPVEEIARMALDAGLNAGEIAALQAGADLALTPEQDAALRASLAAAYARPPDGTVVDAQAGSVCGSSGNPTPATHAVPAVTGTHTHVTENAPGNTVHTGTVGGGTVTLRHDVDMQAAGRRLPTGFAVSYQGTDSQNAHWLQFIWREIVQKDSRNRVTAMTGSITTTGGTYDLTAGGTMTAPGVPGQSNYNTDTASTSDPFYEAGGINNRTADATTIYDHPGSADAYVRRAFANGATEVKSRAHFATFLVQTNRVTYRTETNIEWSFAAATDTPAPAYTTGTNGAASSLTPDALRQRFHAQFPAFNYIR